MKDTRSPLRLRLRLRAERACSGLVHLLAAAGISPNVLTTTGGLLAASSAWPAVRGDFVEAGTLFLAGSALDALDGPLARMLGRESRFGAVLDAVMDRLGEGALLAGLCMGFALHGDRLWAEISSVALVLSFLASYLRAWGERFGLEMAADWMTRPERVLVLGIGLMVGLPHMAVSVVALFSTFVVCVRLWRVGRS